VKTDSRFQVKDTQGATVKRGLGRKRGRGEEDEEEEREKKV
jgi:hypothetical protein